MPGQIPTEGLVPPPPTGDEDPLPPGAIIPDLGMNSPSDPVEPSDPRGAAPQGPDSGTSRGADQPSTGARPAAPGPDSGRSAGQGAAAAQKSPKAGQGASAGEARSDADRSFADRVSERIPGAARGNGGQPEGDVKDIPWERPDKYGYLYGFYQTVLRALFDMPRFFALLPLSEASWLRPVVFYIILGVIQSLFGQIWFATGLQAFGSSVVDPQAQAFFGALAQEVNLPLTLVLAPGTLVIQLAVYTGLFYLMLRLVHPEGVTFIRVLRIVSYSAAPAIFCLVPLVGHLASPVWFAVCCFAGCKYALRLTWIQTTLAIAPLYLVVFAVVLQALRQLATLG